MTYFSIEIFLKNLRSMAERGFQTREVHEFLLGSLIEPQSLDPYIGFRSDRYARNLLFKDEAFELLIICWGVGHKAPIHGHEGELCWARVERGSLHFTNYRELSEAPLLLETIGTPTTGRQGHLDGPADIHAVENLLSFDEPAVSLHVYSRPYSECDIYDLEKGEKLRVQLDYDMVFA